MIWRQADYPELKPRYFLNGFPKSGLHLVACMVSAIMDPQPPDAIHPNEWVGTYGYNAWVTKWAGSGRFCRALARLQPGHYMKGHAGWRQDIDDWMRLSGIAVVFIYRDLRDVAVSQAFHVMDPDANRFKHPARMLYQAMDSFDDVLAAVIEGVGPFKGVVERWEGYAPWLEVGWILPVKYEDAMSDLEGWADNILTHGIERARVHLTYDTMVDGPAFDKAIQRMVGGAGMTNLSPTFRVGGSGKWREYFKDRHKELFKRAGGHDWLFRLGYEDSEDW